MGPTKHCDDYTEPQCVVDYINYARAPAHGALLPRPAPRLFATLEGKRVRITMASRFGDVGVSHSLKGNGGYSQRVGLDQMSEFSATP